MNYLFDVFFEPIFVMFLLGSLYIILNAKYTSDRRVAIFLIGLCVCMILWRLMIAQISSRYWSVILFPGLLIVGYVSYLPNWGKRISRLVICSVLLACVGKDLRLNWNNSSIINAGLAIKEDSKKYSYCLVSELDKTGLLTRIGYYSNVMTTDKDISIDQGISIDKSIDINRQIDMLYEASKGLFNVLYIVELSNITQHAIRFDKLKRVGATVIFSQYKDMKKKKKLYVYKIPIPSIEKLIDSFEPIVKNGDFEEICRYTEKDSSLSWFYPREWGNVKQWQPNTGVQLEREKPISGKNSVKISGGKEFILCADTIKNIERDGWIIFNVCSANSATVMVIVVFCDEKGMALFQKILLNTKIPNNKLHQLRVSWEKSNISNVKYLRFCWYIKAPNGLIMDNVAFSPFIN